MRRLTTLTLGAVLAVTTFAACGDDSSSSGGNSTAAYCDRIQAYKDKGDELDVIFAGTEVPKSEDVEKAFTTMQGMVHDLQKGAPSEIKADVDTMAGAIDGVVTLFAKYDWDLMALSASEDMATLQTKLQGADMQAANDRLDEYTSKTCGIDTSS